MKEKKSHCRQGTERMLPELARSSFFLLRILFHYSHLALGHNIISAVDRMVRSHPGSRKSLERSSVGQHTSAHFPCKVLRNRTRNLCTS